MALFKISRNGCFNVHIKASSGAFYSETYCFDVSSSNLISSFLNSQNEVTHCTLRFLELVGENCEQICLKVVVNTLVFDAKGNIDRERSINRLKLTCGDCDFSEICD
jgi:hypothetical protein